MSLATASAGGMGGGGLSGAVMAHNTAAMPHQHTQFHGQHAEGGPSASSSGGPQIEQPLSLASHRQVQSREEQPLISVDLYGTGDVMYVLPEELDSKIHQLAIGISNDLKLIKSEKSYKAIKKVLTRGGEDDFVRLFNDAFPSSDKKDEEDDIISIPSPHLLLGSRRISDLPASVQKLYPIGDTPMTEATAAIEPVVTGGGPFQIRNQTLDGASIPRGNDFDRVGIQLDLLPGKKKPLALLPEDAVMMLLNFAKKGVFDHMKETTTNNGTTVTVEEEEEEEEEENDDKSSAGWMDYSLTIPLPSTSRTDIITETLMEMGIEQTAFHSRALSSLHGALLQKTQKVITALGSRMRALLTIQAQQPQEEEEGGDDNVDPVVILVGRTTFQNDVVEMTAVKLRDPSADGGHYGSYSVLTEMAASDPATCWNDTLTTLQSYDYLSESEKEPCLILTYGSAEIQKELQKSLKDVVSKTEVVMSVGKKKIETMGAILTGTKVNAVAFGSVVRYGCHYQRLDGVPMPSVKMVSASAVGMVVTLLDGNTKTNSNNTIKETDVKILFDFDRRVPAGPYVFETTAAECAAVVQGLAKTWEDVTDDMAKKYKGFKKIATREEAAQKLKIQIVQKVRKGHWLTVGDVMTPLYDKESDTCREDLKLEISLSDMGVISTKLTSSGESIAQANSTARWSTISYYFWVLAAILFFGGFLFKSWWEERVFDRDVKRLLAYYKHVVPGSYQDGDLHNARYMVYKYRNKKKKLWKGLEVKYGVPCPEEWPEDEQEEEGKGEEELNLDDEGEETEEGDEDGNTAGSDGNARGDDL